MTLKDKRRHIITITGWKRDQEYLDSLVARLKRTRQKTNKSALVELAIDLLRQKSTGQIERLMRDRDPAA